MKNARFWEFVNSGWVKITIRPGQYLRWGKAYLTDEGYNSVSKEWWFSQNGVNYIRHEASRDCDGGHSCIDEYFSPVPMRFKEWDYSPNGAVPDWRKKNSRCHDQFAEMMNY